MRYRRAKIEGATYFFTVVTNNRVSVFNDPHMVQLLRLAIKKIKDKHPFTIDAFILLPDHLHCIWTLPSDDSDFSMRWRLIKSGFSRNYKTALGSTPVIRKKESPVWQGRFWEHLIRDENDFKRHVEYIHYNPVKHELAKAPKDWKYSSFHRFVAKGKYNNDWGAGVEVKFEATVGAE
jgi:putative transposase